MWLDEWLLWLDEWPLWLDEWPLWLDECDEAVLALLLEWIVGITPVEW